MNYLSTDLTVLKEYATFDKQSTMDETIYDYIELLRSNEEPESVIEVLRFFGRSSLRVLGVSFAKYQTIADNIGVSKRTVIRAVKVLEAYGIIDKMPTLKKWAGKSKKRSVNVIRIMARQNVTTEEADEANEDTVQAPNEPLEPSKYNHNNSYVLETGLKNAIPTPIYDALSPFYEAKDIQRLTGVVFRAKSSVSKNLRLEDNVEAFRVTVMDVVRRFKGGSLRNMDSYLYVSLRKLFRKLLAQEVFGWK
jgi:Helix-turn-helix domain